MKNQREILDKLGIETLNAMQIEAQAAIHANKEVLLLSPTGTGKTLAFLLPLISSLNHNITAVQAIIVVPSRELAIQIEQVIREMGSGYKCNAMYGGQSFNKDRINLKHPPAIVVATPGRLADHLRRNTFDTEHVTHLVLDEFDKSLEIGFEDDMSQICAMLSEVKKHILTSATNGVKIPMFTGISKPTLINYLNGQDSKLEVKRITSSSKDKLNTLVETLNSLKGKSGIVFCNYKDSIQRVSEALHSKGLKHGCFYGGLEQNDRERALIKFRNGSHPIIIATDLAARGLDIPEISFIIHYHLPLKADEFTHRNGRTARMKSDGTAYVLVHTSEHLPHYLPPMQEANLMAEEPAISEQWKTVLISGGRKDKISKGDIAGMCFKEAKLSKEQVGLIELKQDCAFVAIRSDATDDLISRVDGTKLKTKKVKLRLV
ncbi:MAG: DEAD/DEAH box helicase [Salibacteraceae bacterium]